MNKNALYVSIVPDDKRWALQIINDYEKQFDKLHDKIVKCDYLNSSNSSQLNTQEFTKFVLSYTSEYDYFKHDDFYIICPGTVTTGLSIMLRNIDYYGGLLFSHYLHKNDYVNQLTYKLSTFCRDNGHCSCFVKCVDHKPRFSSCIICHSNADTSCDHQMFICANCVHDCTGWRVMIYRNIFNYGGIIKITELLSKDRGKLDEIREKIVINSHRLIHRYFGVNFDVVLLFVMSATSPINTYNYKGERTCPSRTVRRGTYCNLHGMSVCSCNLHGMSVCSCNLHGMLPLDIIWHILTFIYCVQ